MIDEKHRKDYYVGGGGGGGEGGLRKHLDKSLNTVKYHRGWSK